MGYGIFETKCSSSWAKPVVNYCLIYRTSETLNPARSCEGPVSYYLVYGTSETGKHFAAGGDQVNYYLVYGASETSRMEASKV